MSRRDTILVAALLNVGLLLVLLVSALKNREVGFFSSKETDVSSLVIETKEEIALEESSSNPVLAVEEGSHSSESAPPEIEVVVQKGDMLEKIAKHYNTSVAAIVKTNALSSTQLKIGQVLKINPLEEGQSPAAKAREAMLSAAPSNFYTVKTGDNPWMIAVKHHIKVDELLKLNNMSEEKARRLKPGDQIQIR